MFVVVKFRSSSNIKVRLCQFFWSNSNQFLVILIGSSELASNCIDNKQFVVLKYLKKGLPGGKCSGFAFSVSSSLLCVEVRGSAVELTSVASLSVIDKAVTLNHSQSSR